MKNVEKITVNFGESAAPQTLKEENFTLFENETEIPFEFSAEKDKVYITAEFKENREYKLVIKSIVKNTSGIIQIHFMPILILF